MTREAIRPLWAAACRRYRQRVREGLVCVRVEVAPEHAELLVEAGALKAEHLEDRTEIGRAIERLLADLDRTRHV